MQKPQIGAEVITKFFSAPTIKGWIRSPYRVVQATIFAPNIRPTVLQPQDYTHLGAEFQGFLCQALLESTDFPDELALRLELSSGETHTYNLAELRDSLPKDDPCTAISDKFFQQVRSTPEFKILDIGGRARSGLLRKNMYGSADVTVLDIMNDEGVDVVADAHELSSHLPPEHYDGVISVSVFEHLIMPWQVAIEMNKVLKPGGLAMIHTHQTIGLHDMPWDFYRFSRDAWKGIFNKHTGFEIIATGMSDLMFIQPFVYEARYRLCESSAGFEGSACLARKISSTSLSWPLTAADITNDTYPDSPDSGYLGKL
jgi:SAM-dependent methyltransferase